MFCDQLPLKVLITVGFNCPKQIIITCILLNFLKAQE